MTKQEFITNYQRLVREENRRSGYAGGLFFLSLMAMIPLSSYIEHQEFDSGSLRTVIHFLMGTLLLVSIIIVSCYGLHLRKRYSRCPHCQKLLFGLAAKIVIATGNCGNCGCQVFDGVEEK